MTGQSRADRKTPQTNEYHREYHRKNRWRWRRARKIDGAMRTANYRATDGRFLSFAEVESVLDRSVCYWCERELDFYETQIDHVIALSQGGPNTLDNLVVSCRSCNQNKHARPFLGRWCERYDKCQRCGRTDRPHNGGGFCKSCYYKVHGRQVSERNTRWTRDHDFCVVCGSDEKRHAGRGLCEHCYAVERWAKKQRA